MSVNRGNARLLSVLALGGLVVAMVPVYGQQSQSLTLNPSKMKATGIVDPRFASYNIEMVEVTGGRFWRPYKSPTHEKIASNAAAQNLNQQVGQNTAMFQYRPPIDLSNARLRKLAAALGPSYVRVSGSWANSTYFQNDDNPAMKVPPKDFNGVMTRAEWKGVVDFSHAVGAVIVTSVAVSPGVRDAHGDWDPSQAKALFDYTKSIDGHIAATEFMNEPNFPGPGGAPAGYDAEAFAKDIKTFEPFLRKESPQTIFLGPSAVGEGVSLLPAGAPAGLKMKILGAAELMKATPPVFDAFSYHFYGTVSHRCLGNLTVEQAMTAEWLDRTDMVEEFYAAIRDKYLPGKSMWLTETAEAACGGDQLAGQFVDTFRYLNQLGTLAQKGVQVVMHNTLASSDYGLLDEDTYEPRPDYWVVLLWKHTMGNVVLNPAVPKDGEVRVYAQCMKGKQGGVTLLAVNMDMHNEHALTVPVAGESFTLTAPALTSTTILLNGVALQAASDGTVLALHGELTRAGEIRLAPESVAFLTLPSAKNASCGY